jgi:hypothetical protein
LVPALYGSQGGNPTCARIGIGCKQKQTQNSKIETSILHHFTLFSKKLLTRSRVFPRLLHSGSLAVQFLIEKNLFRNAQFPAGHTAVAIPLAPAGKAPGLGATLTKTAIRTRVFFPFLASATPGLKNPIHSPEAPKAASFFIRF